MSIDFLTGFEHGLASGNGTGLFDGASSAAVSSAAPRSGTYHGRLNPTGGAFILRKNHTARNVLALHAGIKRNTLPGAGTIGQIHSVLTGGTAYGQIEIDENGVLYAAFRDSAQALQGTRGTGPTLPNDGLYHRLEVLYDMSASPNTITWKVDGADQAGASFTNAARTCTNSTWGQAAGASTYQFDVDDWIQGTDTTDYPFGGWYKVIWLVAGSDGTHSFTDNDFSTGEAGTQRAASYTLFYDMVNDAAPWSTTRSTTDNIAQRVARSTAYVEIAPEATPETGTALAVRALMGRSSAATQANSMGCIARNSAGTAVVLFGDLPVAQGGNGGALADYSDTANQFHGAIVTNPGSWTPTEVSAIRWRLGGAGDISPVPTVQCLALEIAYAEAVVYQPRYGAVNFQDPGVFAVRRGIRVPRLWKPKLWVPDRPPLALA